MKRILKFSKKRKTKKKKPLQSNAFLPEELITEIISLLSIKTIVRFRCVSKSWNILISDPNLVEKHLSKSSQNPHLILTPGNRMPSREYPMSRVVSLPVRRLLLENQSSTVSCDNCHGWENTVKVVGTCNGLLCLLFRVIDKYSFRLWNPAMRTISKEFGTFQDYKNLVLNYNFWFRFGCDISTGTYKMVSYRLEEYGEPRNTLSKVKIFSFSDNCWRKIESFPSCPILGITSVQHLSGTVNWLALSNYQYSFYYYNKITSVQQFVIVSLDLSTETYTQFLLPSGFDRVPHIPPSLQVLSDCLCFFHDFERTELVIWQMKEFGVQESWTQLFRIEYFNLQMNTYHHNTPLLPLYLSKNEDTLILAKYEYNQLAIIYNGSDKSVKKIRVANDVCWFSSMNYVESLVSPPWKIGFVEGPFLA